MSVEEVTKSTDTFEVATEDSDDPYKEFRTLENFDSLNESQINFFTTFTEFCDNLKFNSWEDDTYASRALKVLSIIVSRLDATLMHVVTEWYFAKSPEILKETARFCALSPGIHEVHKITDLKESPNRVLYYFLICLVYNIQNYKEIPNNNMIPCANILRDFLAVKSEHVSSLFSAKAFFYITRAYEMVGRADELRRNWLHMLNVHNLLHYQESYACLINLILRYYIKKGLWIQARNFTEKVHFAENVSNVQSSKYQFSLGEINIVLKDYKVALECFENALTSSQSANAVGFKQAIVRYILLVKLLMGDFPDRKMFINECYFKGIVPYFNLIKAIKRGSPKDFEHFLHQHIEQFERDRTAAIILRLHHNVIKAALKRISLSYSCISLTDIAQKLQMTNPGDIEFILAKAIKENVINAEIDHERGFVSFKRAQDIYNGYKPQKMLHQRSETCLSLYNKFITSMSYPKINYTLDTKSDKDRLEELSDIDYFLRAFDDDIY